MLLEINLRTLENLERYFMDKEDLFKNRPSFKGCINLNLSDEDFPFKRLRVKDIKKFIASVVVCPSFSSKDKNFLYTVHFVRPTCMFNANSVREIKSKILEFEDSYFTAKKEYEDYLKEGKDSFDSRLDFLNFKDFFEEICQK